MESSVSIPMEMVPQYPIKRKVSMLDVDVEESLYIKHWYLTLERRIESSITVSMETVLNQEESLYTNSSAVDVSTLHGSDGLGISSSE